ncbi:ORF6N domain-containing protein [Ureibacillus sinduriensis]|nr:ORF6N domain-containing protein [Ureibacillus sinduriensis]
MEYNGDAVVETRELARMYCRPMSEITRVYLQNKERFKEGQHFHLVDGRVEESASDHPDLVSTNHKISFLWTDCGLYEHAALMDTQLAWQSYCQFIYFVFNKSEKMKQATQVHRETEDLLAKRQLLILLAKELF